MIDWSLDRNSPVLTGDLEELGIHLAAQKPPIKMQWGGDGFWHASAVNVHDIMQIASQNAFLVEKFSQDKFPQPLSHLKVRQRLKGNRQALGGAAQRLLLPPAQR